MSLRNLINQDRRVRRLQRMLRNGDYNVNTAAFRRELQATHSTRLTRRLTVKDVLVRFQTRFLRAVLQNQANRSRFVEIKITCFDTHARLDQHLTKLRQYLMLTYGEQLRRAASTVEERRNVINSCLSAAVELQQEIETVIKIADMVVADIDQTGWAIRNIITAMELIQERGKQL